MGWRQRALTLGATAAVLSCLAPPAIAFHEGGVGACEGCHDLHSPGEGASGLLRGGDASSTCLLCHAERGGQHNILSNDGSSFTPGGDFYWLKRNYSWIENGEERTSPGDSHGHNVVAIDYAMSSDAGLDMAPGGAYPSSDLSCVSCHDPHGQRTGEENGGIPISGSGSHQRTAHEGASSGNYRLLGGVGYRTAGPGFSNDAPVALAPSYWNETDQNHVDYGSGMSEWCANCHRAMLGDSGVRHPAGATAVFSGWTAEAYGAYVRTGDMSGNAASSYSALVPFERGVSDLGLLDPTSSSGPEPGVSNVMCLTCHRVHASAFRSIGRWDLTATILGESHPGMGDGGDAQNSYYGRNIGDEFGTFQRSLCNKCHLAD